MPLASDFVEVVGVLGILAAGALAVIFGALREGVTGGKALFGGVGRVLGELGFDFVVLEFEGFHKEYKTK